MVQLFILSCQLVLLLIGVLCTLYLFYTGDGMGRFGRIRKNRKQTCVRKANGRPAKYKKLSELSSEPVLL